MLGPFGAGVLSVLIPQVRDDLGTTTAAVTAGITVYMVPFAALQLVSGTLGERWGVTRTVRAALTPPVLTLSPIGALGYLAISGMSFVVALLAADELGAGPTLYSAFRFPGSRSRR